MTYSNEHDFMSIGQHCSVDICQQLDFLPLKCDCCNKVFCLDHGAYAAHNCKLAVNKELEIFVCPICAKGVRLDHGENANEAFEKHARLDCDPSNYARVHHKAKCPVLNCREKLTSINTYQCKKCGQRVCLKHRFSEDHDCEGFLSKRKEQSSTIFSSAKNSLSSLATSLVASASAPAKSIVSKPQTPPTHEGSNASKPVVRSTSNTMAAAAAEARANRLANGPPKPVSTAPASLSSPFSNTSAGAPTSSGAPAARPAHVPAQTPPNPFHPSDGGGGAYRCHLCSFSTEDPVCLVTHVEVCSALRENGDTALQSAALSVVGAASAGRGGNVVRAAAGTSSGSQSQEKCVVM